MAKEPTAGAGAAPEQHEQHVDSEHHHADDGSHEIAGFRVGVNPIPFSVVLVFLFILFIAIVSWVPVYGF
jgi:hypothetical protein